MHGKRLDILVLIILTALDILYGFLMKDTFFGKAFFVGIVGLVPAVTYLGFRKKKNWKKIAVATLLFGGLFGFIFEFKVEITRSYIVPSPVFPTIFGFLQPDNILGHIMMTFLILVFYEHFIERDRDPHISKNIIFAILPGLAAVVVMISALYNRPQILFGQLSYFRMGIAAIIPPILLGFFRPKFIKNMAETAVFFFFLYFAYELEAVKLGYWVYPGNNYIGWVTLFDLKFPIEEMLFWMLFYAASIVSYYELFVDVHPVKKLLRRKKR